MANRKPTTDNRQPQTANRAVALIMTLYIIIVFVIMGVVLTGIMASLTSHSKQELASVKAYYIAEAGIQYDLNQLKTDTDWSDNTGYTKSFTSSPDSGNYPTFSISYNYPLVACWHLDGDAVDATGNGNDGTIYGATTVDGQNDLFGKALSFDGVDDYVSVTDSASLKVTDDLTVEFWVKPTNIAKGRQNIVDKAYGGEFAFTQETNGSISFYWGTSGGRAQPYQGFGSGANSVVQNEWHHFVLVRDLTKMKLYWYKDGSQINSTDAAYSSATASTYDVTIGYGYTGVYYEGTIDEVRIYNIALGADEIADHYDATVADRQPKPRNVRQYNILTSTGKIQEEIGFETVTAQRSIKMRVPKID